MQQDGVVTRPQAIGCGFTPSEIDTRIRRGEFQRLWTGVLFVDADMFGEPSWWARARGALLLHGPSAALTQGSAARLLGIAGADTDHDVIQVVLPPGTERHQETGIELHFQRMSPDDCCEVDGLRTTSTLRTLADLALTVRRNCAIAAMDSALHQGLLTTDELQLARAMTAGRRNCRRADGWWDLADGRSESPLETWCRLDCVDGGVPPDELQWNIHDRYGVLLGRADMAWKRRRRELVGEADGVEPHSAPKALFKDRSRANNFVGASVDIVRFTWIDARTPGACARTVQQALNAAD